MKSHETLSCKDQNHILVQMLKQPATHIGLLNDLCSEKTCKELSTLANAHGITPQFYKTFKHTSLHDEMQPLTKHYKHIVQANLLLTAHLLTVTKSLEEKGFNYLSIKGPTLAQELYQDISMRQFSDIDLFVELKDMLEISELLIELGYSPILPLTLLKRKKFLALDNDFSFRHKKSNALLELHWKLFPTRHKMPMDFTRLYHNAKTLSLQNKEVRTLSENDNLLYLSLHGAKHIFERYEWVYDLHMLIQNNLDIDLIALHKTAKEEALDVPFLLGIFLSHTLFETRIPQEIETFKTKHIETLLQTVLDYYDKGFVYWDESDKKRARFLFLSQLFQNKESKSIWLFKSLFKTTPVDVITFNLPNNLAFLYPVLRPFRLLYKHLFTKKPQYA